MAWIVLALQLLPPIPGIRTPSATAPHVAVRLIAEQSTVAPGQSFWVGVEFVLEPGWHLYWINPGDSGEPPKIAWTVPEGFRMGAIEWPRPERLPVPPLVDFGFAGTVMLLVPATAPASARPGTTAALDADLNWLVCRDLCVSGSGHASTVVKVARQAEFDAAARSSFETARRRLPKAAPASWKQTARATADGFDLMIDSGRTVAVATFFPFDRDQIDNAAPQRVEPLPRGFKLTLRKSADLRRRPAALRGVVTLASGDAYVVNAPIAPR
jgi:thiol:disulfide interchange protein DsbD